MAMTQVKGRRRGLNLRYTTQEVQDRHIKQDSAFDSVENSLCFFACRSLACTVWFCCSRLCDTPGPIPLSQQLYDTPGHAGIPIPSRSSRGRSENLVILLSSGGGNACAARLRGSRDSNGRRNVSKAAARSVRLMRSDVITTLPPAV